MEKTNMKKKCADLLMPQRKIENILDLIAQYRTSIMGLAAIWIFIYHEWQPVTNSYIITFIEHRTKMFGYAGVDIFFFLSGIGMAYSIEKTGTLSFYYKRIKRILLPFLAIACIRCGIENWGYHKFLGNITGYNFYVESLYSFLWFVPAIVSFYLVFPIYWKVLNKIGVYTCTLTTLLLWLIWNTQVIDTVREDLYGFTNRVPVFVIGILTGCIMKKGKNREFGKYIFLPIILSFIVGIIFMEMTGFKDFFLLVPVSNSCVPTLLIAVSLPFIVAKILNVLECHKNVCVVGGIINRVLSFLGGISLELYCLQEWYSNQVINLMKAAGWSNLKINLILFLEIVAIAYCASVLFKYFWIIVEYPFRKKKVEVDK